MILTGTQIIAAQKAGDIVLEPFDQSCINPNSYNYRLSSDLIIVNEVINCSLSEVVTIDDAGYVLLPGQLYLGRTDEIIGSARYAMSLIGRSSLGRLGLFLQISANLGHRGSVHKWTLELKVCKPLRVYPHMQIGQVSFWQTSGAQRDTRGYYAGHSHPAFGRIEP